MEQCNTPVSHWPYIQSVVNFKRNCSGSPNCLSETLPKTQRRWERRLEVEVFETFQLLGNADLSKLFVIHAFFNDKTSEGKISWTGNWTAVQTGGKVCGM